MREPRTDAAVRRRMAMARYARSHNKSQAARHFGCCWATIQAAVQRVEEVCERCRTSPVARAVGRLARWKSGRRNL